MLNRPSALVVVVEQWSLDESKTSSVFATLGYFSPVFRILVYPSHVLRARRAPVCGS